MTTYKQRTVAAAMVFGDTRHTAGQSYNVESGANDNGLFPRTGSQLAGLAEFSSVLRAYCVSTDPICAGGDVVATHLNYFDIYSDSAAEWVQEMVEKFEGPGGSSTTTESASTTTKEKTTKTKKTTTTEAETTTSEATTTTEAETTTTTEAQSSVTSTAASSSEASSTESGTTTGAPSSTSGGESTATMAPTTSDAADSGPATTEPATTTTADNAGGMLGSDVGLLAAAMFGILAF